MAAYMEQRTKNAVAETHVTGLGTHRGESRSKQMAPEDRVGDDDMTPEILGQGLEALEGKKKAWYSYLTTRDFWIVLAIG